MTPKTPLPSAGLDEEYWKAFLDHHAFWPRLSDAHRQAFLDMPIIGHAADRIWNVPNSDVMEIRPDVSALLAKAGAAPTSITLHRLIRLFQVCHAAGDAFAPGITLEKLGEHLRNLVLTKAARSELSEFQPESRWSMSGRETTGPLDLWRFGSRKRLESFLAIAPGESGLKWELAERIAGQRYGNVLSMFTGLHVTDFAKAILKRLFQEGKPMALEVLLNTLDASARQASVVSKAVRGLVQWVFVVVDYDPAIAGLRIGLWPKLFPNFSANLQPEPPPSPISEPTETFGEAFLCADMAVVLAATAAKPLRLKKGNVAALFAADERELGLQLEKLPDWIGVSEETVRVNVSLCVAQHLGFVTSNKRHHSLSVTPAGLNWLTISASMRLRELMDGLRKRRWNSQKAEYVSWGFSPVDGNIRRSPAVEDILAMEKEVCEAWQQLSLDHWFEMQSWLDYAARDHNPIVRAAGAESYVFVLHTGEFGSYQWVRRDAERLGAEARQVLVRFFCERLLPLGGVQLGKTANNKRALRLTELGRYYMGAQIPFPALAEAAVGRVVLQPNFEIVFLGANLAAEVALSGFCERVGRKTGVLFRLTRASLQHAIQADGSLQEILKALEETTDKPIPANVRAELTSWDSSRRTFTVGEAIVLRCPDHNVALRIHGILRDCSTLLSQTVLELNAPLTLPQRRKLVAAGFFEEKTKPSISRHREKNHAR